jgi:hypothetical protein
LWKSRDFSAPSVLGLQNLPMGMTKKTTFPWMVAFFPELDI